MKRIEENIIKLVIDDLVNTSDTHSVIAHKYNISISVVEKINECKIYTNFHEYKNNIRKESHKKRITVQNEYFQEKDYYNLKIVRIDNQTVITKISKIDVPQISKYKWTFKIDESGNYRIRSTSSAINKADLSTWLLQGNMENVVDHINRDTLDNRRENLRLVSRSINATNAKARLESKTNIRGVYRREARPGIAKASWICEWSDDSGRHSKSFSIDKYGEEEAFGLAKSLREEKMKEMKI